MDRKCTVYSGNYFDQMFFKGYSDFRRCKSIVDHGKRKQVFFLFNFPSHRHFEFHIIYFLYIYLLFFFLFKFVRYVSDFKNSIKYYSVIINRGWFIIIHIHIYYSCHLFISPPSLCLFYPQWKYETICRRFVRYQWIVRRRGVEYSNSNEFVWVFVESFWAGSP